MNPATIPRALDAHSRELILQANALTAAVPADQLSPARRRSIMRQANALFLPPEGPLAVQRKDVTVPLEGRSLPARLYSPLAGNPPTAAADVLLVFFHGGGWVVGDLETHDNACAFLTQHLGCKLLSVEYRKAPEHPFPAPCDDAAEAYAWAWSQVGSLGCQRIVVSGDSAGGHLAAHALFANAAVPTAAALLFYPVADVDFANASYSQRGDGPGLTGAGMLWFWEQFVGSTPGTADARAVLMRQAWARQPPPTVVTVAWHDPLHDEGAAYARLLQQAGAQVEVQVAGDMAHGFLRQCRINAAAQGHVERAADGLLGLLGK